MPHDYVAYQVKYIRENYRQINLKISREKENDMLAWLESKGNMQAYLKDLIRKDMEENSSRT